VFGRVAARLAGVPAIVHTTHGLYAQPGDPLLRRAGVFSLERVASMCSQAELVQNEEDLETLARLRVPRRKLRLLGNGIDLKRFDPAAVPPRRREELRAELGIAPGEVVVGTVARLVWEKGYREVFTAAAELRQRAPAARFVVIGASEPDKRDAIAEADVDAAAAAGVNFLGHRRDVEDLYAASDVFVLASHREGFPRSAMEAAAMGLPVVVSDIRGCRQVVDDGKTGILVPVRDGHALAAAIARLVEDSAERERMGRAGIEKAHRDFDDQRVIEITLDTYRSLGPHP
jgi:glycosyltransferase involved in cell wall biosynthesis